jgi:deoxyribonuclease V
MIVCVDVAYEDGLDGTTRATAAAVVLDRWDAPRGVAEHVCRIDEVANYVPGEFYERELPCVLAILDHVELPVDVVVIDGYVVLDGAGRRGLGGHLHEALGGRVPVVGVAKNPFHDNPAALEILRGGSRRPLYVTALGVDPQVAAAHVREMHGRHRLPTMLKRVDRLCRDGAQGASQ